MINRSAWRAFFEAEKALFERLNDTSFCECLYGSELAYLTYHNAAGVQLEKPPRYVHWVGQLVCPAAEQHCQTLMAEMRKAYQAVQPDKPLLSRWPSLYHEVEQLNISCYDAYSSYRLKAGERFELNHWALTGSNHDELQEKVDEQVASLHKFGLLSASKEMVIQQGLQGRFYEALSLTVSNNELFRFAGSRHIQARRHTGQHYRALLRHEGQSAGRRVNLGLIIIDADSELQLHHSLPQAPRPHRLELTALQLELPVPTTYTLYIKPEPLPSNS